MIILIVLDIVLSLMTTCVIYVKLEVKSIYRWHGLRIFSKISLISFQDHIKWVLMWLEVYYIFLEFMVFKKGYEWNGRIVMSMKFLKVYHIWSKSSHIRRCVSLNLTTATRENNKFIMKHQFFQSLHIFRSVLWSCAAINNKWHSDLCTILIG